MTSFRSVLAQATRYLIGVNELKVPFVIGQVLPREGRFTGPVGAGNNN
jgi:hypothetical protein